MYLKGDCQKAWWCEDGKLQTDICTPLSDGTETCNNTLFKQVLSRNVFLLIFIYKNKVECCLIEHLLVCFKFKILVTANLIYSNLKKLTVPAVVLKYFL